MARTSRVLTCGARRPRVALALWLSATAFLAVLGLRVGQNLAPTTLNVPGTESAREARLADDPVPHSTPASTLPAWHREGALARQV